MAVCEWGCLRPGFHNVFVISAAIAFATALFLAVS